MTADLPVGEDDQRTTYTYGTTKGASAGDSKIATGHLLHKVQYPDSSGGTDVVTFAYNARGQLIWTKDQEGNVVETDFDKAGQETHRRITTLATGFDGAVRRISTTYDDLGRRQLVTQYDNATVGSGSVVDEVKFTYDDWSNVEKFEQDRDSAVSAGGDDYEISYTYAKATTGRNTVRRTGLTLPDGASVTYQFLSLQGRHDNKASRVTRVKVGTTIVAEYDYNGTGQVVGTDYPEPDVMWEQFGSTSGSYPDLDRFNRVTSSRWTKDLSTDKDFYDLDITYDRNSNIPLVEDHVHGGFDVDYTIDRFNRLTQAEEGDWNSSTSQIDNTSRNQLWTTLSQTGNWELVKLDLNGDGDFIDTDEYKDDRTHNKANEITDRDVDDDGTNDYSLTFDKVGNLTDDGQHYEYEYDPFGRLRKVKDTSDQSLVAEYTYNGLGYWIGWHYDVDVDGDVDGNDVWYYFAYDERWRIAATFRSSDTDPKEQFIYHNAGNDGLGRSSYIDTVILRDKDANTAWSATSDGTLEERIYYCQNWRADVVALVTDTGTQVEQARYSAYGVPFGLLAGDADSDGDVDESDVTQIQTWIDASPPNNYDVRGDLDLDGDVDTSDKTNANNNKGTTLGWGVLSNSGSRKGYAGYELDEALAGAHRLYYLRDSFLSSDLGRRTSRTDAHVNAYAFPTEGYECEGCPSVPPTSKVEDCSACEAAKNDNDDVRDNILGCIWISCNSAQPDPECIPASSDPRCEGRKGFYDPATDTVKLCCAPGRSIEDFKNTINHEFVHYFDDCANTPMPNDACAACVVKELRANFMKWGTGSEAKEKACESCVAQCAGKDCSCIAANLWPSTKAMTPKPWEGCAGSWTDLWDFVFTTDHPEAY